MGEQMNDLKKASKPQKGERDVKDSHLLVIYGGGGHGRSLIDAVRVLGKYEIVGIVDDELDPGTEVMGVPVLGDAEVLPSLFSKGVRSAINAVGGIGDVDSRIRTFEKLQDQGFNCPTIVHPTATIEPSARLSFGAQILPHAYIGTNVQIGFGVIINNGAIVSHDCLIEEYSSLAPGAMLAGEVKISRAVQIGMGVTINLRLSVGERAMIGNSAVIKHDVPAETVVRAGTIWPSGD